MGNDKIVNYNIKNCEIFNLVADNFNVEKALNEAKKQGVKDVRWLTATAYDATLVLAKAIKGVRKVISKPDFKVNGDTTGDIHFNGSDRADPKITLVKIVLCCQKGLGYRFVPVTYPNDCASR